MRIRPAMSLSYIGRFLPSASHWWSRTRTDTCCISLWVKDRCINHISVGILKLDLLPLVEFCKVVVKHGAAWRSLSFACVRHRLQSATTPGLVVGWRDFSCWASLAGQALHILLVGSPDQGNMTSLELPPASPTLLPPPVRKIAALALWTLASSTVGSGSPRSWANLMLIPCEVFGFVAAVETCLVCTGTLVWGIGNGIGPCDIGGAFDDAGTSASKVLFGTAWIPGAWIPGDWIPDGCTHALGFAMFATAWLKSANGTFFRVGLLGMGITEVAASEDSNSPVARASFTNSWSICRRAESRASDNTGREIGQCSEWASYPKTHNRTQQTESHFHASGFIRETIRRLQRCGDYAYDLPVCHATDCSCVRFRTTHAKVENTDDWVSDCWLLLYGLSSWLKTQKKNSLHERMISSVKCKSENCKWKRLLQQTTN